MLRGRAGESSNFLPANLGDRFWILPASAEFYRQLADGRRRKLNFFTGQSGRQVLDFTGQRRTLSAIG